jgi:hypothetical protein
MRVLLAVLVSLVAFVSASSGTSGDEWKAAASVYMPYTDRPSPPETPAWPTPVRDFFAEKCRGMEVIELIADGGFQDVANERWQIRPGPRAECQPRIWPESHQDLPGSPPRELYIPACSGYQSWVVNTPIVGPFRPDRGAPGDLVAAKLEFVSKPVDRRFERLDNLVTLGLVECADLQSCADPDARRSTMDWMRVDQHQHEVNVYMTSSDVTLNVLDFQDVSFSHFEIAVNTDDVFPSSVYIDDVSLQVCTRP